MLLFFSFALRRVQQTVLGSSERGHIFVCVCEFFPWNPVSSWMIFYPFPLLKCFLCVSLFLAEYLSGDFMKPDKKI